MKVSYIVPVYNIPYDLLHECLESIRAAALTDYEIIIVDDGSAEPVSVVPHGDIRMMRQRNGGLSVARNSAIERATGDYIQFVDADDALLPKAYRRIQELLLAQESDIITFRYTHKNKERRFSKRDIKPCVTGAEYLATRSLHAAACMYVFRRSILRGLRFTPRLKQEDERFTPLLFLNARSIVHTSIKAYFYRQRQGSLQHSLSPQNIMERQEDLLSTILFLRDRREKALERRVHQLTTDYVYNAVTLRRQLPDHQRRGLPSLQETRAMLREKRLLPLPHRAYTLKFLVASYYL